MTRPTIPWLTRLSSKSNRGRIALSPDQVEEALHHDPRLVGQLRRREATFSVCLKAAWLAQEAGCLPDTLRVMPPVARRKVLAVLRSVG